MNEIIKQPYALTVAKFKYNIHEMRIMRCVIRLINKDKSIHHSYIEKNMFGDKIFRISSRDVLDDVGSKNHYAVKRAIKGLMKKTVHFLKKNLQGYKGECDVYENLVQAAIYERSTGIISLKIGELVFSILASLEKAFTVTVFELGYKTSSSNVLRIVDYVHHFSGDKSNEPVFYIDKLREMLSLGDKYDRPASFKKRIIDPAIAQLKNHSDLRLSIDSEVKKGRKIIGWRVSIYREGEEKSQLSTAKDIENALRYRFKLSDTHIDDLKDIIHDDFVRKHLISKIKKLAVVVQKKNIANVAQYVYSAIKNEFPQAKKTSRETKQALSLDEKMLLKLKKTKK